MFGVWNNYCSETPHEGYDISLTRALGQVPISCKYVLFSPWMKTHCLCPRMSSTRRVSPHCTIFWCSMW